MKIVRNVAVLFCAAAISMNASAQRLKLLEGDVSALKSETSINFEFTYDNMKVGKYDNESEYVADKTADYNKKEPGKGDTWAKSWVSDRQGRYEPRFIESFLAPTKMTQSANAKYTLIFKTTSTEPGFNIGVMRRNAEINGEAWIVETANRDKVIAKISVSRAPGGVFGGFDFDTGLRLTESYATAGKSLGKFVKKG